MAQTSGFDPTLEVKTCFNSKMFDVANWVARVNGEDGPGGSPSHETLSMTSQGALKISSVIGLPPSMVRDHFTSPRVVAKPCQHDEGHRPSHQRLQYPNLYRCLKQRLGRSFRAGLYKKFVVRHGKKASHKCPGVEVCISGPERSRTSVKMKQCWLQQTTQQQ